MAIATTSEYKSYAGITTSSQDAAIAFALSAAEGFLKSYCGVASFNSATYTDEVYSGDGTPLLTLKNGPVTSITAVKERDDAGATTTLAATTYRVDTRIRALYRIGCQPGLMYTDGGIPELGYQSAGSVWPRGFGNVLATYVAGYSTIPDDLKLVCFEMVNAVLADRGRNPAIQSESIGGYSVSFFAQQDQWDRWKSRLTMYKADAI